MYSEFHIIYFSRFQGCVLVGVLEIMPLLSIMNFLSIVITVIKERRKTSIKREKELNRLECV